MFLGILEKIKEDIKDDNAIIKQYNDLKADKNIEKDGGKRYESIFNLLTNHPLVNEYADKMDSKELLEFITKYISAPMPPVINQEIFNELVKTGIENDKRESLWRLAVNYNGKKMDFSLIINYFIEKKDDYYLLELLSAACEDTDLEKVIKKVVATNDKDFMNKCAKLALDYGLITTNDIERIKKENNLA